MDFLDREKLSQPEIRTNLKTLPIVWMRKVRHSFDYNFGRMNFENVVGLKVIPIFVFSWKNSASFIITICELSFNSDKRFIPIYFLKKLLQINSWSTFAIIHI